MRKEKEIMYTVYRHYNRLTNKSYIGMTSQNPKARWNNGNGYKKNSKMWSDIKKSDWNTDWKHNIIGQFEDKDEALKYEAFMIAMLGTVRNGYNTSTYGGTSYKRTEESRKKMSESKIGEKNPNFGKHHSEETKKKMSEARIGNHNRPQTPVLQYSKSGEFIAEYPSIKEAERQTGCYQSHICNYCKGKYKSTRGFIWRYKKI